VGVAVAAGSVHETPSSAGASYMLERLAFCETRNRGLGEISLGVEATDGKLGAVAGRERMFYSYGALRDSLPLAVELLLDCVRNPAFLRGQVRSKVRGDELQNKIK
jgi:processing peptidase subunit alpha